MSFKHKHFMILLLTILFYIVSTLIFSKGFLLSRNVVHNKSDALYNVGPVQADSDRKSNGFRKAVIIFIDALRYDFMLHNSSVETSKHYENKMPVFHELVTQKPFSSLMFKFIADPPTTTLQRLKGLTTGSLPTFVDAGSNFASFEITEDNIIDQFIANDMNVKFLGDDTWMGLFPERFAESYPFPSFNVMDLHSVDDGVTERLVPEMTESNWRVLIAHFLGVDHCGHRFGPNHLAMAEKLQQMDKVIRSVIEEMESDTILFVMGDHGMTKTGDHGGDSDDEIEAGLFVYSPRKITQHKTNLGDEELTVSQIDFVPTISLLMGIPIPFSNLGMVIPQLVPNSANHDHGQRDIHNSGTLLSSLRQNAQQMKTYLETYMHISEDFPTELYTSLQKMYHLAEEEFTNHMKSTRNHNITQENIEKLEQYYIDYIRGVKEMCRGIWAQFDIPLIVLGLLMTLISICGSLHVYNLKQPVNSDDLPAVTYLCLGVMFVLNVFVVFQVVYLADMSSTTLSLVFAGVDLLIVSAIVSQQVWKGVKLRLCECKYKIRILVKSVEFETYFASTIAVLSCLTFFSNSFVVYEGQIYTFISVSIIFMLTYKAIHAHYRKIMPSDKSHRKSSRTNMDIFEVLTSAPSMVVFMSTCACFAIRSSSIFQACREEQADCEVSVFHLQLTSITADYVIDKNIRYLISVAFLIFVGISGKKWLQYCGNLNGYSLPVICARYGMPASLICAACYWSLQSLPQNSLDALPVWLQIGFPQSVYMIAIVSVIGIVCHPLLIYEAESEGRGAKQIELGSLPYPAISRETVVKVMYNQLKTDMQNSLTRTSNQSNESDNLRIVYGLKTVYSSTVVYICYTLAALLVLLLGDGLSPSVFLMIITGVVFLELHAMARQGTTASSLWPTILYWEVMTTLYFYSTGHQATFTSIQWQSAFTGFHGDFDNNITPAILIHMNTFTAHLFFTAACPLLLFWPMIGGKFAQIFNMKKPEDPSSDRGEFVYNEQLRSGGLSSDLLTLFTGLSMFQGIKLFSSMLAAAILRRHLMVWKIFAPRFIFESVGSFTVFGTCVFMYLIVMRVHSGLETWIQKL